MPTVAASSVPCDLYLSSKIRIKRNGQYVAAVNKVSPLKNSTETVKLREGGDSSSAHVLPGQSTFDPITLEHRMTQDQEFEIWANQVWNFSASLGMESSLASFLRDFTLELYNDAGQLVRRQHL